MYSIYKFKKSSSIICTFFFLSIFSVYTENVTAEEITKEIANSEEVKAEIKEEIKEEFKPDIFFRQGEVSLVSLQIEQEPSGVLGLLKDATVPFYKGAQNGEYQALVGIDLAEPAGIIPLNVTINYPDGKSEQRQFHLQIDEAGFPIQKLSLPDKMVDLKPAALKRVKKEEVVVKKMWKEEYTGKLWNGNFIQPAEGKIAETFGKKRVINGEPRSPHSGEDISAPKGTPVKATNDGQIVMVTDMFFSGKSIFLNHGNGIYSMYFHLDKILKKEGDLVKKGEVIGKVGATGRATGPHLHWGMRINNARVNPMTILKLNLE